MHIREGLTGSVRCARHTSSPVIVGMYVSGDSPRTQYFPMSGGIRARSVRSRPRGQAASALFLTGLRQHAQNRHGHGSYPPAKHETA